MFEQTFLMITSILINSSIIITSDSLCHSITFSLHFNMFCCARASDLVNWSFLTSDFKINDGYLHYHPGFLYPDECRHYFGQRVRRDPRGRNSIRGRDWHTGYSRSSDLMKICVGSEVIWRLRISPSESSKNQSSILRSLIGLENSYVLRTERSDNTGSRVVYSDYLLRMYSRSFVRDALRWKSFETSNQISVSFHDFNIFIICRVRSSASGSNGRTVKITCYGSIFSQYRNVTLKCISWLPSVIDGIVVFPFCRDATEKRASSIIDTDIRQINILKESHRAVILQDFSKFWSQSMTTEWLSFSNYVWHYLSYLWLIFFPLNLWHSERIENKSVP